MSAVAHRNCSWSAQLGSSSLYLLPLQSWWQKWRVIFPIKKTGVTSSLLWTKQFSIMKKIVHLANLVPLQRVRWLKGVMPYVDPCKWLKKRLHYRSIRQCNPSSAFDKYKLPSHLADPFPSLHMYLFQQLLFSCCLLLSEAVHWCASITGTFLTQCW